MEQINIKVERETYKNKKTGNENYTYFIRGNIRGKDVKIGVMPPDIGGYTVLDIVFGADMQADLVIVPFEFKNDAGDVISGNNLFVRSVDEDGQIYECKVKPSRGSDKTLLGMLLN